MVVACTIKNLDEWIGARKTWRPGNFKQRGGKTKMIFQAEGEKLKNWCEKGERQGKTQT
jgi:hypothetical protein